jgi:hypothetical protein
MFTLLPLHLVSLLPTTPYNTACPFNSFSHSIPHFPLLLFSFKPFFSSVPAANTRMTAKSQAKSHTAVEGTADDNISISALPSLIGSAVTPVTLIDDHTSGGHSSSSSGSSSSSNSSKKWAVVGALAIGALAGFLGGIALSKGTIPRDVS